MDDKKIRTNIQKLLLHEGAAIKGLSCLEGDIIDVVRMLSDSKGRLIVTGLGKSGYAARKIAATMSSVGCASMFIHPTEALHGDLGAILSDDIAVCISKSGETLDVKALMSMFRQLGIRIISITSEADSTMAQNSDIALIIPEKGEGDPLGIVPTTSIIATIAIGDAIAVGYMTAMGITLNRFRKSHPGGALGRRLTEIYELMHTGAEIPTVSKDATLRQAIVEISRKKLGTVVLLDKENRLCGIVTDGDVRRAFEQVLIPHPLDEPAIKFACRKPKTITPDAIAEEALFLMEKKKITTLVVLDGAEVVGLLHLHDILKDKVI